MSANTVETNTDIREGQSVAQNRWQSTAGNFTKKLKYIMEHSLLADLTIRLVSDEKISEHQVHGVFFSMASEVFEKMIVSKFKEGLEKLIVMKDVKLETFELLLAYVYNQPVVLTSLSQAEELLHLADYYLMDQLKKICATYCERLNDVSTICYCIELAEKYDLPNLKTLKLNYVRENTEKVLEDKSFLQANENTVAAILDLDSLRLTEFKLFKYVESWINHNMEKKGMAVVDFLIPKLRYGSMAAPEFAEGPVKSKFLKLDQLAALSYYHLTKKDDTPLPPGFTTRKRKYYEMEFCLTIDNYSYSTSSCQSDYYSYSTSSSLSEFIIEITPNKNITISGISIFTLTSFLYGNGSTCYQENVRIMLGDKSTNDSNNSNHGSWPLIVELKQQAYTSRELLIPLKLKLQAGVQKCMAICVNSNGNRKTRRLNGCKATSGDCSISFSTYNHGNYYYNYQNYDISPISSIMAYF